MLPRLNIMVKRETESLTSWSSQLCWACYHSKMEKNHSSKDRKSRNHYPCPRTKDQIDTVDVTCLTLVLGSLEVWFLQGCGTIVGASALSSMTHYATTAPNKWPSYGNNGTSSTCNTEDAGDVSSIPASGRSPGRGRGYPPPGILACKIPWTEEPGGF